MQIISYVSRAVFPDSQQADEIQKIVHSAQFNNGMTGITGVLFFEDGCFFQVLEGHHDIVQPLFARIKQDPRHKDVNVLLNEPIDQRAFSSWSMECFRPSEPSPPEKMLQRHIETRCNGTRSLDRLELVGLAWTLVADAGRHRLIDHREATLA